MVKQPFAEVHAGRPNWLLKVARSLPILGSSKASTIAIVCPLPQRLVLPQGAVTLHDKRSKPYACPICAGVSPVGEVVESPRTWIGGFALQSNGGPTARAVVENDNAVTTSKTKTTNEIVFKTSQEKLYVGR